VKDRKGMGETVREMRTCHEVAKWLQSYLDGELTEPEIARVEDHLETCMRCGLELDTYVRIKWALRESSGESPVAIDDAVALERLRRFADGLSDERPEGQANRDVEE
jgi:anti-sigma factor RsiW